MTLRLLTSPLLLALLCSAQAHAASCVPTQGTTCMNKPCDGLGTSTLDGDSKNIIVCLKNDSGALIWKSSTSGGTSCTVQVDTPNENGYISHAYTVSLAEKQTFSLGVVGLGADVSYAVPYASSGSSVSYYDTNSGCSGTGAVLFQCVNGSIQQVYSFVTRTNCPLYPTNN